MIESIQIREGGLRDLDAAAALWIEMMREFQSFEDRIQLSKWAEEYYGKYGETHLRSDDAIMAVAETDLISDGETASQIVGFCLAYRARNYLMFMPPRFGYISDIVIRPPWRGKGIGRSLVHEVEKRFAAQGVTVIQLQVYCSNEGGQRFWERMGYQPYIEGRHKRLDHLDGNDE